MKTPSTRATAPLGMALSLLLAACAQSPARPEQAPAQPIRLDIVGTSDLHGWAKPHPAVLSDGRALPGGGLRNLAGYLDILRARTPDGVVLVDAGDVFQGTLLSNLFEGRSLVPVLNELGYDAMAVGNHEFDYGPAGPRATAHPGDDPLGALAAISEIARFPVLAHNLYVGDTDRRPKGVSPTGIALVERQGVKVGILGLSTPDTINVVNPVNVAGLRFADLVEDAKRGASELRAAGADVLVAVVHEGNSCQDLSDPNDLSSCDRDRGLIAFAQALPAGLFDAVIGGHSHARVGHFVNGMPVMQSGAQGYAFGIIELTLDPDTRRPIAEATRIRSTLPVCEQIIAETHDCNARRFKEGMTLAPATFEGKPVVPSAAVDALLKPFEEQVAARQRQELGVQIARPLTREYRSESLLGNALSELLRQTTGADFALLNSGGLRADLKPGALTYGALYEVLPFDNNIATLTLTGAEVAELFETLLSSHHGIPQSAGLRMRVELCKGAARIVELTDAEGTPLDPQKRYQLATSDFLAMGGDGLQGFLTKVPAERKDLGLGRDLNMRDAMAEKLGDPAVDMPDPGLDGRLILLPCPDASRSVPESELMRRH